MVLAELTFNPMREGERFEMRPNPFTKKLERVMLPEHLTADEVQAVTDVLVKAGATGPDGDGSYTLPLEGGETATFDASKLPTEATVVVPQSSLPHAAQLIFDLMVAGNWVVAIVSQDETPAIAPSEDCVPDALMDEFELEVCATVDEVLDVLESSWSQVAL